MANPKKTVKVYPLNTAKIAGAGGKYFDDQFQKYARKALQAAGFFPPEEEKAKYGIGGNVKEFKREGGNVFVQVSCHGEEDGTLKMGFGMSEPKGTAPDVKTEKDFLWALDTLADSFAPLVINHFKSKFV